MVSLITYKCLILRYIPNHTLVDIHGRSFINLYPVLGILFYKLAQQKSSKEVTLYTCCIYLLVYHLDMYL